jgi:hypothetical protein
MLKAVLPSVTDLPAGWKQVVAPSVGASTVKDGSTYEAQSEYQGVYEMDTGLYAYSFPTEAKAAASVAAMRKSAADEGDQTLTMPAIGDEVFAFAVDYGNYTNNCIMVRTGTVVTDACGKDDVDEPYDATEITALQSLAELLSQRAAIAQNRG